MKQIYLAFFIVLGLFSARAAVVTGLVQDNSTAPNPVAYAIVTLSPINGGGATYADTTDTQGTYRIANAAAGIYLASAAKTGYNASEQAFLNVSIAAGTYTQDFTLVPRGAGATIDGTVTSDSVNGMPVPGAKVLLREQTFAGTTTLDSAITDSKGKYAIDSIQSIQRTNYVLTVSATGFIVQTTPAITIDGTQTITRNIALKKNQTETLFVQALKQSDYGQPEIRIVSTAGILLLTNLNDAGTIKVCGADGKLLYQSVFVARTTSLTIPAKKLKSGNLYFACITQKNAVYTRRVISPEAIIFRL